MGSSETEGGVLECDTGSIVWVRRRNGSWWPGKILGPNELSTSHLMSPRSGTPVKLLGREDASVDWYNLEKSKRVKAFRCGEFDDCIKRAEASQGMPPKKREKYARREDAILHALELERLLLDKIYGAGFSSTGKNNKSTADVGRQSVTSSEYLENGNGRYIGPKSHQVSTRSGVSLEDKSALNILSAEVPKDRNRLSGDVDNSGVLPRMRGLQDIGLSTAPSEHNYSSSIALNGTDQPMFDSSVHAVPDGSNNTEGLVNVEKRSMSEKRKPSEDALVEDVLVKRRDRRCPLAHVLQSSENLPVSIPPSDSVSVSTSDTGKELPQVESLTKNSRFRYLAVEPSNSLCVGGSHQSQIEFPTLRAEDNNCSRPVGLCEQNGFGSTEYTETDSTESDSLESDTDDELATLSDGAASIELEPKYFGRSEALPEHGSMSSEEVDDFTLADGTSHPSYQESVSVGFGSKWKLKGKRNNRSLNKRLVDSFDGDLARRPSHMSAFKEKGGYACLQDDLVTKSRMQMAGYGSRAPGRASRNMFSWGDLAWDDKPSIRGYWEEASEYFDPTNSYRQVGGRTMLIDVDLKVQSSYQREHVPMISLMSKINGQAIIGHPIQVETLANGSTESFFGDIDDNCPETLDYDTSLQPTWRTARRTASFRVARPHVPSASDNPEGIKHVQGSDHHRNVRKATVGGCIQKANMTRKTTSQPPVEKTFSRKPGKKVSLSSNQKIRTLSSIASQQKQSSDSNSYQVDGALKPETLPTVVACIPVKLVFSRLNEELVGRRQ
ncbi:hypothetical protein RND71_018048 [Anisodus tanguticus]|uniref:PWWP domain-containing protein n=1 Tax=Anisodus tanguticus TaxID=243964 RepID=A0AAE1S4W6_9SOLA|nr:hypothetical protein RND71_018048 [Anisodus tanguticus]